MGMPTTGHAHDAAPAYEDVVNEHPVNQYLPSGSTSAVSYIPDMCMFLCYMFLIGELVYNRPTKRRRRRH